MSAITLTDVTRRFTLPRLLADSPSRLSNSAFTVVVGAIGVMGLVLSLLLNVATTQGAFEEAALTREVKGIEAAQQAAQQTLAMLASPGNIEARARAMGMVPASSPVFLRLADAKVFGKPSPASDESAPKAVRRLMPTTQELGPELTMAPAAVKAKVIQPTSDAAVELPVGQ